METIESPKRASIEAVDSPRLPFVRTGTTLGAALREGAFVLLLAAAVAATFVAIVESDSFLWLSVLIGLQALLAIQAVLLFHDCMHFASFASPRLNTWVGRLVGGFFFWPITFLRDSHLSHHRHAGSIEKDTEALHLSYEDASHYPAGHTLQWLGRRWIGILIYTPYLQGAHFVRWLSSFSASGEGVRRRRSKLEWFAVDVLVMALYWVPINLWLASRGLASKGFGLGFLLPAVIGMMGVYGVSKPLHTGMIARVPEGVSRLQRVLLTSRTFDANPALRVIFCNLNFHIEHHLYPSVSRWELGVLARRLRPALRELARTQQLPLIVHRSYSRWNRDFRRHGTRYNTIRTPEEVATRNRCFEVTP